MARALQGQHTKQVARFLVFGTLAAAVNWLARFPLSLVLPLSGAIVVAYMIGMSVGFVFYRTYVFDSAAAPLSQQIGPFVAVNLVSAVFVLGLTYLFLAAIPASLAPETVREGLAHGVAIGFGAVLNFLGHKLLTFRKRQT